MGSVQEPDDHVDVLIVGAGPAGLSKQEGPSNLYCFFRFPGTKTPQLSDAVPALTGAVVMANWMSRCGVRTRIVDKRGTKVGEATQQLAYKDD